MWSAPLRCDPGHRIDQTSDVIPCAGDHALSIIASVISLRQFEVPVKSADGATHTGRTEGTNFGGSSSFSWPKSPSGSRTVQ